MKVTTKITEVRKIGTDKNIITDYFVDDVKIGTHRSYKDFFHTVKNGVPSNIRNKVKKAQDIIWFPAEIKKVTNNPNLSIKEIGLVNGFPDYKYGYSGPSKPSLKALKSIIEENTIK